MFLAKLDQNPAGSDGDMLVERAAGIMTDFFGTLSKDRFMSFVDSSTQPTRHERRRRNPLEGTYPSMRCGTTMQYPLQAFMHLKHSKKRKPVARLIKPGKYTPFLPFDEEDFARSPYVEQGSKLPQEPSGKFRHIASYSMEELIYLEWDGAMYCSSQGRHAASGRYVPFIVGYDSDSDDEYEPIDVREGERAGIIGLPRHDVGSFMAVPDIHSKSCKIVKLNGGR